jgi:hypothetical protein
MWEYIVCLSFCSILQKVTKLLGFLVFDLGLPIRNKCHKKLDVYYVIVIHYNQTMAKCSNKWDYMFMSQFAMTQFEHISFKR